MTPYNADEFPHLVVAGCANWNGGFGSWSVQELKSSITPIAWPEKFGYDIIFEFDQVRK
jgi:hypothetical protein